MKGDGPCCIPFRRGPFLQILKNLGNVSVCRQCHGPGEAAFTQQIILAEDTPVGPVIRNRSTTTVKAGSLADIALETDGVKSEMGMTVGALNVGKHPHSMLTAHRRLNTRRTIDHLFAVGMSIL